MHRGGTQHGFSGLRDLTQNLPAVAVGATERFTTITTKRKNIGEKKREKKHTQRNTETHTHTHTHTPCRHYRFHTGTPTFTHPVSRPRFFYAVDSFTFTQNRTRGTPDCHPQKQTETHKKALCESSTPPPRPKRHGIFILKKEKKRTTNRQRRSA